MKDLRKALYTLLSAFFLMSFSQCSNAQKLQSKAPLEIGQVYFQKWIAGVEGGGSGINLFIPTRESSVVLDSVYFRNMAVKLESNPKDGILYIGRFKTEFNQRKNIIMSNEPLAEVNNPLPISNRILPFILKENECVISYLQGGETHYFKIENIVEMSTVAYPSAPPNKQ